MFTILVVDDSPVMRKMIERASRATTVPVEEIYQAGDGLQALEILRRHRVDLVLTDINMPNMDGLQLLQAMRKEGDLTPLAVITTEGATDSRVAECMNMPSGALYHLKKPFTGEQLRQIFSEVFSIAI